MIMAMLPRTHVYAVEKRQNNGRAADLGIVLGAGKVQRLGILLETMKSAHNNNISQCNSKEIVKNDYKTDSNSEPTALVTKQQQ